MKPMRSLAALAVLLLPSLSAAAAEVDATLAWAGRVELTTPVGGRVQAVQVDVGAIAAKGNVLLKLDPRPFDARVRAANARIHGLKPAWEEVKRELERAEDLYERTVLSDVELQTARINHAKLEAQWREAHADLALVRLDREYSELRAPFDALVLQRLAEPGLVVVNEERAEPLLVVARAGHMQARAPVPLGELLAHQPGEVVKVKVLEQEYDARIVRLELEPRDGGYALVAEFPLAAGETLRAGMPAKLVLP